MLTTRLTTLAEARDFIALHHRHHQPPQGHKFSIGVQDESEWLRGVIVVGRPVARHLDDGQTLEATRSCTDGTRNANSLLYAAAWRTARGMGALRLITYTQEGETGASLRGCGFREVARRPARSGWDRPGRARKTTSGPTNIARTLWLIGAELRSHETHDGPVTELGQRCRVCGDPLLLAATGRPRITCSDRCRARRARAARK